MPNEPSSWTDLISESVHTSDDQDIGDVEAVSRNFIVVKKGLINVHRYYIPLHRVEGWDGKVVWLKMPEEAVKTNHERDAAPDPYNYHYSSAPTVDASKMSCADFRSICPKSHLEPKKKDHFLFLMNPQDRRSASSSVTFAIQPSRLTMN